MKLIKTKNKEVQLPYIDSLEDLSAFAWSKLQEENDVNWLREGYNGRQRKIKDVKLDEIRTKLEEDCFKLMDDDNLNEILHKRMQIYDLASKYETVKFILQRMYLGFGDNQMESRLQFIKQLKSFRFNMPEVNTLGGDKNELDRIFQEVEQFKTKINLLVDEIKVEGKKITRSLNKDMLIVGQILSLNYMLNPKEISQAYWIELQKLAQEKNERDKLKE